MRFLALLLLFSTSLFAQSDPTSRSWNQPVEPFRIAGNVYYVGASDITSYLITTPRGHIVLDSGFKETVPQILQNVVKLGFRVEDIRLIVMSHAHYDHVGGVAQLQRLTGARVVANERDVALLRRGGRGDFAFGDRLSYDAPRIDRIVSDGAKVTLGGVTLTAHSTPGHTRGCTTWSMTTVDAGRSLNVVFVGSASVPGYQLVGNEKYPEIIDDYRRTFRTLRRLEADVFLGSHGNFFNLQEKIAARKGEPEKNPFIDPEGYREYVERSAASFEKLVADQEKEKAAGAARKAAP
jgi:metallo-beta-lactamase class B